MIERKSISVCPDPIFIIGAPRSGTSILAWSLDQHSEAWTSLETNFLFELFGNGELDRIPYAQGKWFEEHSVERAEFLSQLGLGFNALVTSRSKGKRWIDQSPSYTLIATALAEMFPGAQFIHIVRDGRKVVNSMTNSGFRETWATDFSTACRTWAQFVAAGAQLAEALPERCMTIELEQLSSERETGFRAILEFLRLPYEDGPSLFFRDYRINSSFQADSSSAEPYQGPVDPWKDWTTEQRKIFAHEAGPTLVRLGLASQAEIETEGVMWHAGRARAKRRIVSIVGTRPEAIKMAPVISELERRPESFEHLVVATAQHRQMLDQVLEVFEIEVDRDLGLMEPDQSLADLCSRALAALSDIFKELEPDCVLVQGDTTTVMAASLAAFYLNVRIGHVEAGLRSFDPRNPFPEEMDRRIVGSLADFHFAPTERARENLLREGVPHDRIYVTGNTVVDALGSISLEGDFDGAELRGLNLDGRPVVLVTAHRRESHGAPLRSICRALRTLGARDDVEIVYPMHLNPNARAIVLEELDGAIGTHLVEPVSYTDLLRLMKRARLILTDSGGIQEEAPSFRKPVLVLRDVTERPEVVESRFGKVIGTSAERIVEEASLVLDDSAVYESMVSGVNPFGDGLAAKRIVSILDETLQVSGGRKLA